MVCEWCEWWVGGQWATGDWPKRASDRWHGRAILVTCSVRIPWDRAAWVGMISSESLEGWLGFSWVEGNLGEFTALESRGGGPGLREARTVNKRGYLLLAALTRGNVPTSRWNRKALGELAHSGHGDWLMAPGLIMRNVNQSEDRDATAHVTRPFLVKLSTTRSSSKALVCTLVTWGLVSRTSKPLRGVIVHGLDQISPRSTLLVGRVTFFVVVLMEGPEHCARLHRQTVKV
jgi:hypothetical protein